MTEVLIHVEGPFDPKAAHDLRSRIETYAEDATAVVDFSRVGTYDDFALAILAQGLTERARSHVVLRGLCRRQARVLRYFGVERVEPRLPRDADDA